MVEQVGEIDDFDSLVAVLVPQRDRLPLYDRAEQLPQLHLDALLALHSLAHEREADAEQELDALPAEDFVVDAKLLRSLHDEAFLHVGLHQLNKFLVKDDVRSVLRH